MILLFSDGSLCMRFLKLTLIVAVIAAFVSLAIGQTDRSRTTAARSSNPSSAKPKATPKPTPKPTVTAKPPAVRNDEKADWDRLNEIADTEEKLVAARAFVEKYPRSKRVEETREMIAATEFRLADAAMKNGEIAVATGRSKAAISDLPEKVSDEFFTANLARLPLNLFFAGGQAESIEIAKLIEQRVSSDAARLRTLAEFYLNVENGTEARRVIDMSLDIEPESTVSYMLLGLAERIDFRFTESAAAFAKAIEIDPANTDAKRGLAEMKRATGDTAEAARLYREIIESEPANVGARTGLVLALLENGDREGDEMLERELGAMPDNVLLLGGAAYAYASRNDGTRAVEYGQRAVSADPRFIWSHIALARGLLLQRDPVSAEKVLIAARRYGNFPTLDYEIATVRAALGFYREAADDLARSFKYADGKVSTRLGGRVDRSSTRFDDLIGYERRASIFSPTAADSPTNAATMAALLRFRTEADRDVIDNDSITAAARELIGSGDAMRIHRRLYSVQRLFEKGANTEETLAIVRAATEDVDAGLNADVPAAAILANELYDSRSLAMRRGEYLRIPDVSRQTLSAILRGRIEELNGQALAKLGRNDEAIVRFRRAAGVLPADSSWLRSTNWQLGTALEATGKESDALEAYIRSYAGGPVDVFRYRLISQLYISLKGSTDGLEERIGPDPMPASAVVTPEPTQTPTPTPDDDEEPSPSPTPTPVPDEEEQDDEDEPTQTPSPTPTPESEDEDDPKPTPTPIDDDDDEEEKPAPTPTPTPVETPGGDTSLRSRVVSDGEACEFYVSEELMTLRSSGGGLALIVGRKDDGDIADLAVTASNADDILIRRENVPGVTSRAVFVISSKSGRPGLYYVRLDLPCARRDVVVQVR